MSDEPDLPMPRNLAEADAMLGDARMVLDVQRTRGNSIGLHRIRATIDRLLDARNRLTGPPVCGSNDDCGRVKSLFGTSVWLCPTCDFRHCRNGECARTFRYLNIPFIDCPHCGTPLDRDE